MEALKTGAAHESLCGLAPSQQCPPGTELFQQGASATDVYLIDQGLVKLTYLTADGRELIVGLRLSGSALGLEPVMLGEQQPVSAVTLTRCSLRRVPASLFRKVAETDVGLCHRLLREHCREMLDQIDQLAGLGLSAKERLERLLAHLATVADETDRGKSKRVEPLLKNREIAQLIGVTPQHLSRLLKKMQQKES